MDVGISHEIQAASFLEHRDRDARVFHQVMDRIMAAEQATRRPACHRPVRPLRHPHFRTR